MPKNRRSLFAFMLAAIGGGLLVYGYTLQRQLPSYSESDIASSVELNLTLDLSRLSSAETLPAEQVETLRKTVRAEIEAEIAKDQATVQNWYTAGAVMLVMALSQLLLQRYLLPRTQ